MTAADPLLIESVDLGGGYTLCVGLDVDDDMMVFAIRDPSGAHMPMSNCFAIDMAFLPELREAIDLVEAAALAALDDEEPEPAPDKRCDGEQQRWLL